MPKMRAITYHYYEGHARRPRYALENFFVGWRRPPGLATRANLVAASDVLVVAVDGVSKEVVGFVTAVTDGVLSAYISFLEVLPSYRAKGIGSELVDRVLRGLSELYMVDVVCDEGLSPFYEARGFTPRRAMSLRRYDKLNGRASARAVCVGPNRLHHSSSAKLGGTQERPHRCESSSSLVSVGGTTASSDTTRAGSSRIGLNSPAPCPPRSATRRSS